MVLSHHTNLTSLHTDNTEFWTQHNPFMSFTSRPKTPQTAWSVNRQLKAGNRSGFGSFEGGQNDCYFPVSFSHQLSFINVIFALLKRWTGKRKDWHGSVECPLPIVQHSFDHTCETVVRICRKDLSIISFYKACELAVKYITGTHEEVWL